MHPKLVSPLTPLQILLYTALTLALIAGGVFISSNGFRQIAYVAGSCLFPDEINGLIAEKSSLESQAASLQAEIEQAQANIVNDSSFVSTTLMRIAELQSGILSDYALYLEEQNLNQICSQSSDASNTSCGGYSDYSSCTNTQGCLWGGGTSAYCNIDQNVSCNGNDQSTCEQYSGCGWGLIGGYWAGTPNVSCNGSDQSACERYSGCSWMATETGGYCIGTPYGVSCDQVSGDPGCTWVQGAGYACSGASNVSCSGSDSSSCTSVGGCNWTEGALDRCYNDPNATSNSNTSSSCSDATTAYNALVEQNNQKKTELAGLQNGSGNDNSLTNLLSEKNAQLSDIVNNQIPALDQAMNNAVSCYNVYEECGNGVDDNRDGLTDCEDNACAASCQGNEVVYGCTDGSATNYNSSANQDDGSCSYGDDGVVEVVYGCTDPSANNFDPRATQNDGSCDYRKPEICNDGIDNDKDGSVDCSDPDCFSDPVCEPKNEDPVFWISCEEKADEALKNCLASIDPGDPNASDLAGGCQVQRAEECSGEPEVPKNCVLLVVEGINSNGDFGTAIQSIKSKGNYQVSIENFGNTSDPYAQGDRVEAFLKSKYENDIDEVILVAAHSLGTIAVFNMRSIYGGKYTDTTFLYYDPPYAANQTTGISAFSAKLFGPFISLFNSSIIKQFYAIKKARDDKIQDSTDTIDWSGGLRYHDNPDTYYAHVKFWPQVQKRVEKTRYILNPNNVYVEEKYFEYDSSQMVPNPMYDPTALSEVKNWLDSNCKK